MAVNKVTFGGSTLIDLTGSTVTEETLAEGITAFNAAGNLITGTMSGGGLEYETGTWEPTEDISRGTVNFSRTHSAPPDIIVMSYAGSAANTVANSNYAFNLVNMERIGGTGLPYSATAFRRAMAYYNYRSTNTGSTSVGGVTIANGKNNTGSSSTSYYRYWATESGFRPYSSSTSRFWRAGSSFNWVAVWL